MIWVTAFWVKASMVKIETFLYWANKSLPNNTMYGLDPTFILNSSVPLIVCCSRPLPAITKRINTISY